MRRVRFTELRQIYARAVGAALARYSLALS
jgi:hypothetical protein